MRSSGKLDLVKIAPPLGFRPRLPRPVVIHRLQRDPQLFGEFFEGRFLLCKLELKLTRIDALRLGHVDPLLRARAGIEARG
ncbi:MAG TPA: hypothetical protein VK550_11415 [Polyangiaceae bacterium]|nr:hypothetical protein [Polyangiaceae bacterium]